MTTLTIPSRLINAGFTLHACDPSGIRATAGTPGSATRTLLAAFNWAAASPEAAARALPALPTAAHWVDLTPVADDSSSTRRARRHGITRVRAPLSEHQAQLGSPPPRPSGNPALG